jgi:O-antigen/teichoic acid export membrane protein
MSEANTIQATGPAGVSLSRRLSGAAAWVVFGAGAAHIIRLGGNLIVTRLLAPEMFGLVAVAGLVPMILSMLSDIGFRENVCRSPRGDDQEFLNTLWAVQITRGAALWGGCLVISTILYGIGLTGWLSPQSTYGDPKLPWVIAVSSMSIVISSFHSTKVFSENRHFRIKQLLRIELLTQVIGLVVMIAIAWATGSIWSILISGLVTSIVYVLFSHFWLPGENNRLAWSKDHVTEIMTFGKWLVWSSAFTVLASNGDRILLGAFVSAQILGFYTIAANLAGAVDLLVGQIFSRVVMPGFSEVARTNPERLAGAYHKIRARFDPLMLGLSGFLFAAGHVAINIMYDTRYKAAGSILEILALGLIISRYALAQSVYLATNRPQYLVWLNVTRFVSIYALVPVGFYFFGLTGALFAIAFREVITVPMILYFNSKYKINNWMLELKVLMAWPVGYGIGLAGVWVYTIIQ